MTAPRVAAGGLAGAAVLIAVVTVASRLTGFARSLVLAAAVGPNELGSAYTSANVVPNVLFEVAAGGALAGAVVPLLAAPLAQGIRRDVDHITSALLGWTLVVLVPLGGLMALLARPLAAFLVGGERDSILVAASFLRVFAVQVPLYGIAVVLFGVLQAHRRFAWPALAPLVNNLVVIGVLVVFGHMVPGPKDDPAAVASSALDLLAWGTTAGVAALAACVVVPAWRTGLRVRPTLRFGGVGARARVLMLAGLGAVVAQQLTVLVTVLVSNRWGGSGTFLIWQFLQQVYLLPYAVLAFPLITAAFPRLAERVAADDGPGFARLASGTTRGVALVSVAGAAVLVAAAPAVESVYAAIADGPVQGAGAGLAWMAPGLIGFAVSFHLSRTLYALHRGRSAGIAVGSGWAAVGLLALLSAAVLVGAVQDQARTLSVVGAATTAGMTLGALVAVAALRRAAGAEALVGLARTAGVSLAGGALGAWLGRVVAAHVLGAGGVLPGVLAAIAGGLVAVGVLAVGVLLADRGALAGLRSVRG
ncbi:lipid II flippase MurJ [Isoptericola sp. b441]|uniref:Lipid II flippase MurJ n=1 Tax=Actinotalea lenta TaxID=3064654 RepID=A0ABT9DDJ8_9CELL|nr:MULTISPECIES: lipid II flippase MurJ [unclassified Isoptericola]MDO8107486.1 lipid II flippase MurJ [Isoptericola sp. b441]MDO8120854.1 lipid II flippase MurJ [Isoptericola sp. b490]